MILWRKQAGAAGIPLVRGLAHLVLVALAVALHPGMLGATPREEYDELEWLHRSQLPAKIERYSDESVAWAQNKFRTLHDRGMAFILANPEDPLRWDVLVLLRWGRNHAMVVLPDGKKVVRETPEEGARWNQKYFPMLEDLLQSKDASRRSRREALTQLIEYYCNEVRKDVIDNPRKGVVPSLLAWVDDIYALDPYSNKLAHLYTRVARMLNAIDPARCRVFLENRRAMHPDADGPDVHVRQYLDNFLRLMQNQDSPATGLWEYLARLDSRFGDPTPFRDKVVLVVLISVGWEDRMRELDALHKRHHRAGLEIIQISPLSQDSRYPAIERDRSALERHVAEKGWPWTIIVEPAGYPEQFHRYWATLAYPSILVVGRDGRIAREVPGDMTWAAAVERAIVGSAAKR